jgi:hypothetical protein
MDREIQGIGVGRRTGARQKSRFSGSLALPEGGLCGENRGLLQWAMNSQRTLLELARS